MKWTHLVLQQKALIWSAGVLLSMACGGYAQSQETNPAQTSEPAAVTSESNEMAPQFAPKELKKEEKAPFIETYHVEAHVMGMYAQVTTEMTIRNPNKRVFSGNLELPLPEGAVISGYAIDVESMDIHHQMVDAAVVDSIEARHAYEQEVKKGVDPGLLEAVRGNMFRTRIYPIMPNGYRQVRVQYTMPLTTGVDGATALSLPMVKSELLERKIHIRVDIPGLEKPELSGLGDTQFENAHASWILEKVDHHISPDADLLISMPKLPEIVTSVERNVKDPNETFFSISIQTGDPAKDQTARDMSRLRLIWDASGSRKAEDIQNARKVLSLLPEAGYYEVHVFRNKLEAPIVFNSRSSLLKYIDELYYDGGTNYTPLQSLAKKAFDGMTLFFTDGVDTYSNDIPEFGNNSAAIISGEMYDIYTMQHACSGQAYLLMTLSPEEIYQQLRIPQPKVAKVTGSHISDVEGIGLSAVGRITVVGRLNADSDTVNVILSDGRKYSVNLSTKDAPSDRTITTAWAAARVRTLAPFQRKNHDALLELGKKYTIVTPNASMIVFESLSQWVEYDIEPPETLTEIHAKWLVKHEELVNNKQKYIAKQTDSWMKSISNIWKERVNWWNDPIPHNLSTVYECDPKKKNKCKEIVKSDLGEHYQKDFVPPAGWKCTENNHCSFFGSTLYGTHNASLGARFSRAASSGNDDSYNSSQINPGHNFENVEAEIELEEWDPETPYLKALKAIKDNGADGDTLYAEYMRQRSNYEFNSAFYLDVGDFFFKQNLPEYAARILSNLTELRIDDETILRIYAWRLRDAGLLDESIEITRKVAELRPFENISWRDLAIAYEKRAKRDMSATDAELALKYFHKTAFNTWETSRNEINIALVAIEEFNALADWTRRQKWPNGAPTIPIVHEAFNKLLDTDLRIIIRWDTDNTDIDLHVIEPTTEHISYHHQRSAAGGILSADITNGYGPEEYLLKSSPSGTYELKSHYYASHVENLIGAVTMTATVFTNWGRPNQTEKSIVYRIDEEKEEITIGTFDVK